MLYSPVMAANFAPLLRMSRAYLGMSRREVARRSGLPIIRVFRLENGWPPRSHELTRLAAVLERPELQTLSRLLRRRPARPEAGR